MTTKLLYFNAFICKDGEKTDYPIEVFLDDVMIKKTAVARYKDLKSGSYTMNKMRPPLQEKDIRNRTVWVGKYREKKPYQGQKKSDVVNPIAGDVFEPAICLFIPGSHLLVMEYNYIGCKDKGLCDYFNSFLLNNNGLNSDQPKWSFELIPLKDKKGFDLIEASDQIKAIEINFLTTHSYLPELVKAEAKEKGLIEELIVDTVNVATKVGANITTLALKQSRYKNKMKVNLLTSMLAALDLESDGIISAKVSFINKKSGKLDYIDLKHDGLSKDLILEGDNSNGFEYLASNISEFYYGLGNKKGYNHHSTFKPISVDSKINIFM